MNSDKPTQQVEQATLRMNTQAATDPDPDTLFYLRTQGPEIFNFTISGPYQNLELVLAKVRESLKDTKNGADAFEEATDKGKLVNGFQRLTAAADSDPSKTIVIELLRMKNAEMMAELPGPAYNVTVAELLRVNNKEGWPGSMIGKAVAVKNAEILGSFPTKEAAQRYGSDELHRRLWIMKDAGRNAKHILIRQLPYYKQGELFYGYLCSYPRGRGSMTVEQVISVRPASNATSFPLVYNANTTRP